MWRGERERTDVWLVLYFADGGISAMGCPEVAFPSLDLSAESSDVHWKRESRTGRMPVRSSAWTRLETSLSHCKQCIIYTVTFMWEPQA